MPCSLQSSRCSETKNDNKYYVIGKDLVSIHVHFLSLEAKRKSFINVGCLGPHLSFLCLLLFLILLRLLFEFHEWRDFERWKSFAFVTKDFTAELVFKQNWWSRNSLQSSGNQPHLLKYGTTVSVLPGPHVYCIGFFMLLIVGKLTAKHPSPQNRLKRNNKEEISSSWSQHRVNVSTLHLIAG